MEQFIAFVRKEFYHIFHDRRTLLELWLSYIIIEWNPIWNNNELFINKDLKMIARQQNGK